MKFEFVEPTDEEAWGGADRLYIARAKISKEDWQQPIGVKAIKQVHIPFRPAGLLVGEIFMVQLMTQNGSNMHLWHNASWSFNESGIDVYLDPGPFEEGEVRVLYRW